MYLHLEKDILIPKGKVLGLFDLDNAAWEKNTQQFLRQAEDEGRVFTLCSDLPRSFLLVSEDFGNTTVYLTARSTQSLRKRMEEKSYMSREMDFEEI